MGLKFEHILVPVDFRASGEIALERAIALGADYRADVTLLHVVALPFFGRAIAPCAEDVAGERLRELVQGRVRELRRLHAWRGVALTQVASGSPAEEIVLAAECLDADAIVLSPRPRTALSRAVSPSTTERVLRHASVPVLVVRAPFREWAQPEAESVEPAFQRWGLVG